jgi:hypothetical protein
MKFTRPTAGYTLLDHRRNEDILEELQVDLVENKLTQYKQKWSYHVSRIGDVRYPKLLIDCRHIARRRPGRPFKRLLDTIVRPKQVIYWPDFVTRRSSMLLTSLSNGYMFFGQLLYSRL